MSCTAATALAQQTSSHGRRRPGSPDPSSSLPVVVIDSSDDFGLMSLLTRDVNALVDQHPLKFNGSHLENPVTDGMRRSEILFRVATSVDVNGHLPIPIPLSEHSAPPQVHTAPLKAAEDCDLLRKEEITAYELNSCTLWLWP